MAFTDYPLDGLDYPGMEAPIREVEPIDYDQDKYVGVLFNGKRYSFKAGYLYTKSGRFGEVPQYPLTKIHELPYPSH